MADRPPSELRDGPLGVGPYTKEDHEQALERLARAEEAVREAARRFKSIADYEPPRDGTDPYQAIAAMAKATARHGLEALRSAVEWDHLDPYRRADLFSLRRLARWLDAFDQPLVAEQVRFLCEEVKWRREETGRLGHFILDCFPTAARSGGESPEAVAIRLLKEYLHG